MPSFKDLTAPFVCCAPGNATDSSLSSSSCTGSSEGSVRAQKDEDEASAPHPRFEPCRILASHDIPSALWFEDALAAYGKDIPVFDLFLLVPDQRRAADVLLGYSGYYLAPIARASDPRAPLGGTRLEGSMVLDSSRIVNGVVLLDAAAWRYDPRDATDEDWHAPAPSLHGFLAALMRFWVAMPEDEYRGRHAHLAGSVADAIHHGYLLRESDGQQVLRPGFAERLPPELRELHYDLVGSYPGQCGIGDFRKHEYHALRYKQISEGAFTPRPYPRGNVPVSIAEFPKLTGYSSVLPWTQIPAKKKGFKKSRKGKEIVRATNLTSINEGTP